MNWTGGSLQRTKKANTGVIQQQKAYFARARTQLQNDTNPPVAPFRPSYLQDDEDSYLLGIAPFGSGSLRHTGHAAKRRNERTQPEHTPGNYQPTAKRRETTPHEESHPNDRLTHKDLRDGKRQASEVDTELHLLEANRKRLLTQKDWVGIDPSKPVSLRFRSSREKSKIGKRRRTTRGRGAAPRRKDKDEFGNEVHSFADDAFAHVLGDSGPRQRLDDVRIRIGTDAMTNTYSTQLDQYAQSHASSESMLFDQEEPLAQLRSAKPPVDLELLAATSAFEQADVASRAPSTGEQPQHYDLARRSVASPSPDASEQKSFTGDQFELQCQPAMMTSRKNESSTHDFRLTHHAYGEERAFRLAFSGSNSTAGARGRTASDGNHIGETKPFDDPDSVGESKTGYVHQHNIDRERSVGVDVSAANTIVDEGPWKTYLAITDGSSHSDKSILSRSSVPHDYPTKRHNNEAAMDWSQHATQGQGNESRTSSSSVSASLPSLKRGVRKPISAHASDMALIRRDRPVNAAVQSLDEDEKNWQAAGHPYLANGNDDNGEPTGYASEGLPEAAGAQGPNAVPRHQGMKGIKA
ncbi:uncharacterized protein J4E88_010560 [Alternaria novae-zelandiae]|uniref:uncharacterized protein n=1 Tax=Alternaria novae-zelandiae TaxID=430562 RepID=UPI0020C46DF2|nr:uncharacterized protein J4E88_010560 [Alternaria novae-zelandiae]KAI4665235.1 hypothetical protein J4E88_010560 [Alternaria novae-zelandiae]